MKIAIIGSRGIPAKYGGFETLADRIAAHLSDSGHTVAVIGEQPSFEAGGIRSVKTWFSKRDQPVLFYLESVLRTLFGYDRVLVLGVGAGPFVWLYRIVRTNFITHTDGMEQFRGKFSSVKRWYVRLAQQGTYLFSKHIIADADAVASWWAEKFGMQPSRITVIRYGTDLCTPGSAPAGPEGFLLHGYYLVIARIVPENNIEMILDGFAAAESTKSLVIIGNWDDSEYGSRLKRRRSDRLLLLDPIYDRAVITAYRSGCFAYLHGHSVGGTNPTLVEALGAGCATVCHDNAFNRETTGGAGRFFKDAGTLAMKLKELESLPVRSVDAEREISRSIAGRQYDWKEIGRQYEQVFTGMLQA